MNPIRPNPLAGQPVQPRPQAPASNNARAAFFQQALTQATGAPVTAPPRAVAPVQQTTRAVAPAPAPTIRAAPAPEPGQPQRYLRPGSLIDIKV